MEYITDFIDWLKLDSDVYGVVRTMVALSGFLAILIRIREYFTDYKDKQNLKADLEILALFPEKNDQYNSVKKIINDKIARMYTEGRKSSKILNFLIGLIVFVGFGLWSINLFETNSGFTPGMIATLIFCSVGLSMMLSPEDNSKKKDEFYRISLYGKSDLVAGIFIGFTSLSATLLMYVSGGSYFYGYFVSALFTLIGFSVLIRQIKFKRI